MEEELMKWIKDNLVCRERGMGRKGSMWLKKVAERMTGNSYTNKQFTDAMVASGFRTSPQYWDTNRSDRLFSVTLKSIEKLIKKNNRGQK
jgi:cystathionine beta-lyase family protein involved in aluminum resistance